MRKKLALMLLMVLVIPVGTGLLLGWEMQDNVMGSIPTVIVDHDNTEFSRALGQYIANNDTFEVIAYGDNDQEIEDKIFKNEAYVGVIFPDGLYAEMLQGKSPNVLCIYDGTVMNVVSQAKTSMSEILLTVKTGYMKELFEGKLDSSSAQSMNEIQPIRANYKYLFNPTRNYRNFFLPGMLIAVLQIGIGLVGMERARDEETTLLKDLGNIFFWGFCGMAGILVCLGIQVAFFGMPCRGSILGFLLTTFLFSICQTGFGYTVGKVFYDSVFASQITCVFMLPASILGGYTFPLMAMPAGYQWLAYSIPLARYGPLVRDLALKELTFSQCLPTVLYLACYFILEVVIMTVVLQIAPRIRSYFRAGDPTRPEFCDVASAGTAGVSSSGDLDPLMMEMSPGSAECGVQEPEAEKAR